MIRRAVSSLTLQNASEICGQEFGTAKQDASKDDIKIQHIYAEKGDNIFNAK